MSSFRNTLLLTVLAGGLVTGPAMAVEYKVRAIVDQRVYYDGNIVLTPDPASVVQDRQEKYALAYELAPQLDLSARGPRWEAGLNTILRFSRLTNDFLDSDDLLMDLRWSRTGENMRWDLEAGVDRTSTRSLAPELDFVLAASRVESYDARPGWTLVVNEKDSVVASANWLKSEFDNARFSDYELYGFEAGWIRQLDEQTQLQVTLYNSNFESGEKPLHTDSDTLGLQVGLTRQFSEALSGSLVLGARQVDTTNRAFVCAEFVFIFCVRQELREFADDSSGFTAASGLEYTSELWSLSASLARSLVPNGFFGGLLETDSVDLQYTRKLGPTLVLDVLANVSQEESLDSDNFNRDRIAIEPRVRWRFLERWTLIGSVRYRTRDVGQTNADGLAMIFRVRYEHPQTQWSR